VADNLLALVKSANSPSQLALAELQKRVEADADLAADIKAAFLEDLKGAAPTALVHLRAVLGNGKNDGAA
jgi:hypothetical protein